MIDKVRLYTYVKLDTNKFDKRKFKEIEYDIEETCKKIKYYRYNYRGIGIVYSPVTCKLRITGRLINLSTKPNKVDNLDEGGTVICKEEIDPREQFTIEDYDIDDELIVKYNEPIIQITEEDEYIEDIIDRLNSKLFELTEVKFDVRDFYISYIEICFNIKTSFVREYIKLFNITFDSRKLKQYKNFTTEKKKPPYTSCYIKTKGDYENNDKPKTNYVVNFYNKSNELNYRLEKNKTKKKHEKTNISEEDLKLSEDILRLEIQCKYHYLRTVCKKSIHRTLKSFLDIDLCSEVIKEKYRFFFDKELYGTFYDYKSIKSKIQESDFTDKEKSWLLKYLEKHSKGYSISETTFRKFKKMLASMGIHYTLIPTKWNIEMLDSPIKLLDNRVNELKEMRKEYLSSLSDYMEEEVIDDMSNEEILRILMEGID